MFRRLVSAAAAASLLSIPISALHAQIDPDLLAGLEARSIGPAGMSGRIAAIAAVEADPDIVYAGAATGGVWLSRDGALTWEPIFDDQPVHAIGSIAIYQASPDIVWVGTGEGNPRNSVSGTGYGVFKTMDGGRTWEHLGLEATERIHRIALHPDNPDVAYVGAMGSMWKANPERGVFMTQDGGRSWTKILYVDENTGVADMEMDPTNPHKLIVAMWDYRREPWFFRSGGPGSGLYITVDGGRNWKKLTPQDGLPEGELGRIGLAIAPSNPSIVFALIEAEENGLYKSMDGGFTWSKISTDEEMGNRPFYYFDLRVDPQDPNRVYSLWSRVSVSNDGGKNFDVLIRGGVHSDHHAMWIDPNDPTLIYEGNDGGFYTSRDRGESWKFSRNLPLAQYYHINVDMETPYHVLGGMQDNGSWQGPSSVWRFDGIRNHDWTRVGGGDGFATLADPSEPWIGYSMSQQGYLDRWNLRTGESRDIRPAHADGVELRFNWNAAIAIDPFDSNTIYYGSQFLHRSNDRGLSWKIISPDLTTNNPLWQRQGESGGLTYDVTGAENFTTIMTIAPSAVERGVIWVGTDDGRVHVTRNGGETWESVENNVRGVPKNTWVPHIEPSKYDAGTAFLVMDDHRRGNFAPYVYRTTDYGKSWRSLVTDDLWGYALVLEQDPVKRDLLFLGTEFGLYVSVDGGRRWMKWTHGLPTASVMALIVHPRDHDLVIGTHGRAAYIIDDIRPLREITPETLAQDVHLYDIPDAQQYEPNQTAGPGSAGDGEYRGSNRPYGAILTYSLNIEGLPHPSASTAGGEEGDDGPPRGRGDAPRVDIEILDANGEVIRTFRGPAKLGVNRVAWNLRRDGFERPRAGQGPPSPFFGGQGPEVIPGTYTVRIEYGDHKTSGTVNVLADPRYDIPLAERIAKQDATLYVGALQETLAKAVERIRDTRSGVDDVLRRAREARAERVADSTNGDGATNGANNGDDAADALIRAGRDLKEALGELEERIWTPPGTTKGIVREDNAFRRVRYVYGSLGSSWDAPTSTQEIYLAQAEEAVEAALEEFRRLFAEDVAAFRSQVQAVGIEFIGTVEPLAMPSR